MQGNTFISKLGFDGYSNAQTSSSIQAALTAAAYGIEDNGDTHPFAYINYIIYDENMTYRGADWKRIPQEAGSNQSELYVNEPQFRPVKFGFGESEAIEITQTGYIYIWLSNESKNTRVWFDDLTVTHTQNLVVQATDYGVWGDVLREQKSEDKKYRFGYQGQYAERDEETGWNHFELREYDAIIGRWLVPDPFGEFWSPYVAFGNNPVNVVDPRGGFTDPVIGDIKGRQIFTSDGWTTMLNEVVVTPSIWDSVASWLNSFDFVLEGSATMDIGLRAKVHGTAWGLSTTADINVINVNLLQGQANLVDPLNAASWSGHAVGMNGDVFISNGIEAKIDSPLGGKNKIGVGVYAIQSQRVHHGRSKDYDATAGINILYPVLKTNNKNMINPPKGSNTVPGKVGESRLAVGKKKSFYGINLGVGAQIILGAEVNVKIGFGR